VKLQVRTPIYVLAGRLDEVLKRGEALRETHLHNIAWAYMMLADRQRYSAEKRSMGTYPKN